MLSAKTIPAGGSGKIEVRIKTENLSGSIKKHATVRTNDPRNPSVTLTVKGVVEPEITLSEPSISFGNAPMGQEVRKEIILTLPAGKSIRLLGVTTTDPRVLVKLEPMQGKDPLKWKLIAIRRADANPGYHFGEIVVKTSSALTPKISVYELGTIRAPGR